MDKIASEVETSQQHALETRLRLIAHSELLRADISSLEVRIAHTESAASKQREETLALEESFRVFHEGNLHYDSLGQQAHVEGSVAVLESKLKHCKTVYAEGLACISAGQRALAVAREKLAECEVLLASGESPRDDD